MRYQTLNLWKLRIKLSAGGTSEKVRSGDDADHPFLFNPSVNDFAISETVERSLPDYDDEYCQTSLFAL